MAYAFDSQTWNGVVLDLQTWGTVTLTPFSAGTLTCAIPAGALGAATGARVLSPSRIFYAEAPLPPINLSGTIGVVATVSFVRNVGSASLVSPRLMAGGPLVSGRLVS